MAINFFFVFWVKAYYFIADNLETALDLSDINSQLHSIGVLLLVDLTQYVTCGV